MIGLPLILVIDDVEDYRERILPVFVEEKLGGRVYKAGNVQEALQVAADHAPGCDDALDLIILDMHLPIDAKQATIIADDGGVRFLLEYKLAKCPIVVFTAYPTFANCVAAVQAGAVAYISKVRKDNEGGPEALYKTCMRLLSDRKQEVKREPPTGEWIERNYKELGAEFDGKWVAFVDRTKLSTADAKGKTIVDGVVLLAGNSYEDVRSQVIASSGVLKTHPVIIKVRGARSASHKGEE